VQEAKLAPAPALFCEDHLAADERGFETTSEMREIHERHERTRKLSLTTLIRGISCV
jgi:hypothetical protein